MLVFAIVWRAVQMFSHVPGARNVHSCIFVAREFCNETYMICAAQYFRLHRVLQAILTYLYGAEIRTRASTLDAKIVGRFCLPSTGVSMPACRA